MKTNLTCLIGCAALLLCAPAIAQNKPAKPPERPGPAKPSSPPAQSVAPRSAQPEGLKRETKPGTPVRAPIQPEERKVIQAYIDDWKSAQKGPGRSGALPPGLARKAAHGEGLPPAYQTDGLPPGLWQRVENERGLPRGWRKRLTRGGTVPIEAYRRADPLPDPLVARLPAGPPGSALVAIDGKVLRVDKTTREIHDVFEVRP
jgi:hypothetical protein